MRTYCIHSIISLMLLLCSCSDKDIASPTHISGTKVPLGIVGRWYSEDAVAGYYLEDTYTDGGVKYSTTYHQIYGYCPYQTNGSYSLSGNQLTTNMSLTYGEVRVPTLSVCSVDSMTQYSFCTRSANMGLSRFSRIIGTIYMNVGEHENINAAQYLAQYSEIVPDIYSYSVADESVISVDNSGNAVAKLIGDTYIQLHTSQGTAVLKASVSDTSYLWNDYSAAIAQKFSNIEKTFGKFYAYKNDTSILYIPQNYYVDSVKFTCNEHRITDCASIYFSEEPTDETMEKELCARMVLVDKTTSDSLWFTDNTNYLQATYSAHYDRRNRQITYQYTEPEWDDLTDDLGLSLQEIKDKYGNPRNSLHFGNKYVVNYENIIKNEFITSVQLTFSPNDKLYQYVIFYGSKVSTQMVTKYLEKKFHYYNSTIPYARNYTKNEHEYLLYVNHNDKQHRLYYTYEEL